MSIVLTGAAVLALAQSCVPNAVDPNLLVAIAKTESDWDPSAIKHNPNGTTDYGLMQINSRNFGWLGLTPETALDPCRSLRAGYQVLTALSRYNTGNTVAGFSNGYVARVSDAVRTVKASSPAGRTAPLEAAAAPAPLSNAGSRRIFVSPARAGHEVVFVTSREPK